MFDKRMIGARAWHTLKIRWYKPPPQIQTTTADYPHNNLLWDESVYAMHEVLGKEGTLGRESETEMVLTRYLGEKLMA